MPSLVTRVRSANVGIIVLILAIISGAIWLDRQRVIEAAYRDVDNLAGALSLHVRNDFGAIDGTLLSLTSTLDSDHLQAPSARRATYEALAAAAQDLPGVHAIFIIGPDGHTVNTSRSPSADSVDMRDRQVFTVLRDDPDAGLFIESPVKGRAGPVRDQWIINAGRRLERSDGSFAGVVATAMSLSRMQDILAPLDLGEGGIISLFRSDGIYILRHPQEEAFLGRSIAGGHMFR
jgi:hypothetical protein